MNRIFSDIYQLSNYMVPINLSFHQYLIDGREPLLVHTGSMARAPELLIQLREVLGSRELKYIFVSHFESDECGGLSAIVEAYPEVQVLASQVSARQLQGFGLISTLEVKGPGEELDIGGKSYEFISYPSEMHLWEGLLLFEKTRGILYSSDLMISFGDLAGQVSDTSLEEALGKIGRDQIPWDEKREEVIKELASLDVSFIAPGHGRMLRIV